MMDVYDPQTLGVMVFGSFMVISAIGIFLVSTFSMKETSYEEALAKQRKELEKTQQQKTEKKKKEKPVEKRGKAKKKEEKPNGKIPEQQLTQEVTNSPKDVCLEPAVVPEPVTVESPVTTVSVAPQEKEKPAPSPKEKRKKEKKVAKVEPAPSPVLVVPPVSLSKTSPVLDVTPKEVPVVAVPPVGTQQSTPVISSNTIKKTSALPTHEEQKHDGPVKKKSTSKKKSEPGKTQFVCIYPHRLSHQGILVLLKQNYPILRPLCSSSVFWKQGNCRRAVSDEIDHMHQGKGWLKKPVLSCSSLAVGAGGRK